MKRLLLLTFLVVFCLAAKAIVPMEIKVDIQGLSEELTQVVREELSLFYLRGDPLISPSLMDIYIERAEEEIQTALQPYGYYNPIINSHKTFVKNQWLIRFHIEQGPPIIIRQVNIQLEGSGRHIGQFQNLKNEFPLKSGDVFIHETYESGKKLLLSKVILEGYLAAQFTEHRIEVNIDTQQADIYLLLNTNPLYTFGRTDFTPSALCPEFLQRYVDYDSGDPFSAQALLDLEDHLRKSDYFSRVNILSQPDHEQFSVPILVELEDNKPNHYLFGIGYGTDTGARGKVGYLRRRVNSWGHKFQTEAQLSEIYQKIEADYIIPGKHPHTDNLTLHTEYIEDEYTDKPVDSFMLSLNEKREIYGWERTLGLSFIKETSVSYITNAKRRDQLLMPTLEIKKSIRDNPNNPRNGSTRIFRIKGSLEELASDISFAQVYYQHRWLHTFEPDFKTLLRLELGATFPRTEDKLPLSQRFFAGGDNSIRGFGYRSLPAEIDKDGVRQPVGGSYLFIGSLELSKPIKDPLSIHTFIDTGNAFRNSTDNLQVGIGGGLSYNTAFGPIKISIAKPITNAANSWRLHASFGPEV